MQSDVILPDWQAAQIHAKAANIGLTVQSSDEYQEVCECCQNPVQKSQISLGANVKTLHFLGFGVPLFYHFLLCCIILNLLLIVTDDLYAIVRAAKYSQEACANYSSALKVPATAHYQSTSETLPILSGFLRRNVKSLAFESVDGSLRVQCTKFFVYYSEINEDLTVVEMVSRVCSFIIHVCCLIFIKNSLKKTRLYYDEIYHHLSDYSVIFKELELKVPNKVDKMKEFIRSLSGKVGKQLDVREIILVPENQNLEGLLQFKEEAHAQYLQLREARGAEDEQKKKELIKIGEKVDMQARKTKSQLISGTNESKNVIVIFQTEEDKVKFLSLSEEILTSSQFSTIFKSFSNARLEQCPDPKEIMWTNLKYTADRNYKIAIGWFLSVLFFIFTFMIFYLLQRYKNQFIKQALLMKQQGQDDADSEMKKAYLIAWSTWVGIIFYNKFVMSKVLDYLTRLQKHDNISNEDFSFAFKYAIGMFFTSSIMKILVQAIQNNNYYKQDFGIIQEESMMLVFSALFLPLLWLLHPTRLVHLFQRWRYYGRQSVTQIYANYIMADYPYMIRKRYAEIIEMMWFTYLYTELIPLGGFLMFLGQCAYYWIDKYNLLRRSSLNYSISGELSAKMNVLLDLTLFWRFLGSFIFDFQLRGQIKYFTLVMLAISIVYVLLPWDKILQFFDHQDYLLNKIPYSQAKVTEFKDNNYRKANAIQTFIDSRTLLMRRTHQLSL